MRLLLSRYRGAYRVRRHDDDGFTLVELMVTMFVISAVLLGLMTVQVQALQTVSLAKQRQQATALANRTMEQIRALPYDTVSAGLNSGDLVGDPNISIVGGVAMFTPAYDGSINEMLQTSTGQNKAPLFKHVQDASTAGTPTKIGNIQYRVRSYVSRVHATQDLGFHLTVVVDWTSAATKGQNKLTAVRSQVFSPTGCSSSSTATRPFAGPCQAFFYTDAGSSPSGITVESVTPGQPLVQGSDVTRLESNLPTLSTRTQTEQIVSSQSVLTTHSAKLNTLTGTSASGGQSGTSAADTDPASGLGSAPAAATPVSFSGSSTLSSSSSVGTFSVSVPSTGAGSTYSTTGAASTPPCRDTGGNALVTNQACSSGEITPSGSYSAAMNLSFPSRNLGAVTLASISTATSTTWRAFGARAALPVSGHCSTTTGIGCVTSGSTRALGTVVVGGLPVATDALDLVPSGFSGLLTLDGFTAQASAEAGISPDASTAIRGSNVLKYWNGSGYTTVTLGAAGATYSMPSTVASYYRPGLPPILVSVSGTVTVDPAAVTPTGTAPCETAACSVTASVGTVRTVVQYDITDNGVSLGSFVVTTDLGSTITQSTYKAAPSA